MSNDKVQQKTLIKWEQYKKLKENESNAERNKVSIQRDSRRK
jgi:hypothetical protein